MFPHVQLTSIHLKRQAGKLLQAVTLPPVTHTVATITCVARGTFHFTQTGREARVSRNSQPMRGRCRGHQLSLWAAKLIWASGCPAAF